MKQEETINEMINRIATEFTCGKHYQSSKPLLMNELEILVLTAKKETIKELSKSL